MARRVRSFILETRNARRRLAIRKRPYWITISPGTGLGYRRNNGAGTWSVRGANGRGSSRVRVFAVADDVENANGRDTLDFWSAQDRARAIRREEADHSLALEERIAGKALAFLEQNHEPGCYLYRLYHPSSDLLYVGISLHALARQVKHAGKSWYASVYKILVEPFATREEALTAEEFAIQTEFPKFNSRLNARRHPVHEMS
jgi:hypothetical protein